MKTALPILACVLLLVAGCASQPGAEAKGSDAKMAAAKAPRDRVNAYVDLLRADLSDGKVAIINQVMKLSDEEARAFWPIYRDYEEELFENGDQRLTLIRQYVTALSADAMTDAKAKEMAAAWFAYQNQELEVLKKYHGLIEQKLSPVRAAQFAQIEHRFGLVVDLALASELPLVPTQVKGTATATAK